MCDSVSCYDNSIRDFFCDGIKDGYFTVLEIIYRNNFSIDVSVENGPSHRAKTPPTKSRHVLDFTVFN